MSEIIVLASARAKVGREDALEKAFRAAIQPTHEEAGCFKYALHQSVDDAHAFVMIEKWASQEALDQHLKAPHIQKLFKQLPDLLERPMQIQVYKAIREGSLDKLL